MPPRPQRLSTFWSIVVPFQTDYSLVFTGTPPKRLRLHMPAAADTTGIVMSVQYMNAQRIEVEFADRVRTTLTRMPTLADPTGSYLWNATTMTAWVVVRGGLPVTLIQRPVVAVTLTLDTSLDTFFEDRFVANVAFLLGIDASRIKIVSIRRGSVIINMQIGPDPTLQAVRRCSVSLSRGH
jgi:hypothetical protein